MGSGTGKTPCCSSNSNSNNTCKASRYSFSSYIMIKSVLSSNISSSTIMIISSSFYISNKSNPFKGNKCNTSSSSSNMIIPSS
nr:hypothetical protein BaRGS_035174 [Batillaria attramentaria]